MIWLCVFILLVAAALYFLAGKRIDEAKEYVADAEDLVDRAAVFKTQANEAYEEALKKHTETREVVNEYFEQLRIYQQQQDELRLLITAKNQGRLDRFNPEPVC